jgi:hypothetical protein
MLDRLMGTDNRKGIQMDSEPRVKGKWYTDKGKGVVWPLLLGQNDLRKFLACVSWLQN